MTPPSHRSNSAGEILGRLNNGVFWLVCVSGLSYLTSLLRQRFLYQHQYGTHGLDYIVVSLAGAAIVGNALGVALSFWWSAHRVSLASLRIGILVSLSVCAFVAPFSAVGALLVAYVVASAAFMVATQRAAGIGHQFYALLAAVTAPGSTILIWKVLGVSNAMTILLGYAVGAMWQAGGAWLAALGSDHRNPSSSDASLLWPVAYIAAIQVDGVADTCFLLLAGAGWASACGYAYNIFSGTVVVVIAPLSIQALAGRLNLGRPIRLLIGGGLVAMLYVVVVPLVLRIALEGGAVAGEGYDRILKLTLLYAPAIPFAIYWQLVSRADHRNPDRWKALAYQAGVLFSIHLALLMVAIDLQVWLLVPLATCGAFAIVTLGRLAADKHASVRHAVHMIGVQQHVRHRSPSDPRAPHVTA